MDHSTKLSMPIGEAMFTQRSIRRFKPDPIPMEHIRLIMEAAVKAPNGANKQIARFLVVTDRAQIREFGALYREAWWAKRREEYGWTKPEDIPVEEKSYRSASGLAERLGDVPCVVFAFGLPPGSASSVIPAAQNLMLAARALGIGSIPTTLHPTVMARFQRHVRHSQGAHLSLLHPPRLSGARLRPQRAQADLGDHVSQPLGRGGAVDVRRVNRQPRSHAAPGALTTSEPRLTPGGGPGRREAPAHCRHARR